MNLYQIGQLKTNLPEMGIGDTIKIYEKVIGEKRRKSQVFEGVLIAKKHGKGVNATFTVRAILDGVGVEKIYPLNSPLVEKIELIKRGKVRRAKLYYLRKESEKKARKKLKSEIIMKVETKPTAKSEVKKENKHENKGEVKSETKPKK